MTTGLEKSGVFSSPKSHSHKCYTAPTSRTLVSYITFAAAAAASPLYLESQVSGQLYMSIHRWGRAYMALENRNFELPSAFFLAGMVWDELEGVFMFVGRFFFYLMDGKVFHKVFQVQALCGFLKSGWSHESWTFLLDSWIFHDFSENYFFTKKKFCTNSFFVLIFTIGCVSNARETNQTYISS